MIAPKVAPPTKAQENEAYELTALRDMGRCVKCGRGDPFFGISMDHRKNRSAGGLTLASDLQQLCGTGTTGCHGWKTANPKDATAEGYSVPGWAEPREWPARRWVRDCASRLVQVWCLYTNDGRYTEISDAEAAARMRGDF